MAKTDHENGTVVTSAFLDTMYLTGDGHKHDAGTEDGSCSKVSLADHVSGQLDAATMILGILPADNYQVTGIEAAKITTDYYTNQEDFYIPWVKTGNIVILELPNISSAQSSESGEVAIAPDSGDWSSELIASSYRFCPIVIIDNSHLHTGCIRIPDSTSGSMVLFRDDATNEWLSSTTFSGGKGFQACTAQYSTIGS